MADVSLNKEMADIENEIDESLAKRSQFLSYIKMTNSVLYLVIATFIIIYIKNIVDLYFNVGGQQAFYETDEVYGSSIISLDKISMVLLSSLFGRGYCENLGIILAILFLILILRSLFVSRSKYWRAKLESNNIKKKEMKIDLEGRASYFERLVKINLDNLSEYYDLVQTHTNKSFEAARLASIMGVCLIFVGLIIGWSNFPQNSRITYLSAASGIIIELISGLFYYLYNQTVIQLKEYHDSLLDVQNILLSFKIVEDMEEENEKVKNVENMISYLIGKQQIR